jgi:hypothetical protein
MDIKDAEAGMAWWNELTKYERAFWLAEARSAVPAQAWEAYKAWRARQWATR